MRKKVKHSPKNKKHKGRMALIGRESVFFPGTPDAAEFAEANAIALNQSLHALLPGDTLIIPKRTFHILGGVEGVGLRDVTIRIDGTLLFSPDTASWPHYGDGTHRAGLAFWDAHGLTISSSRQGTLDGNGRAWWSVPGFGYLMHQEKRPRLLTIANSTRVIVERILFKDSPYWTTLIVAVEDLIIRHCGITARRTKALTHSFVDLSAFNADGFDVAGCRRVWIHDCDIWTQDDAIAVKDYIVYPWSEANDTSAYLAGVRHGASEAEAQGEQTNSARPLGIVIPSEDMLFERINASGLGLTIGSIGDGVVRNITFRDCYLKNTVKGLYLKFNRGANATGSIGRVSGITYENIWMDTPEQWPIWIGPAQQADASNPCFANPCSLCWPMLPGASCTGSLTGVYSDILLRNVHIFSPSQSPGVILGARGLPMSGVVFDSVVVHPAACREASPMLAGGFHGAFSRLPNLVVPDPNITVFYVLVTSGSVLLLIACIFTWARGGEKIRAAAALLLFAFAALAARLATVSLRLKDTTAYYMCEGVERGIATGATWPIPHCFVDKTTRNLATSRCSDESSWWAHDAVVLGSLSALAVAAAICCLTRVPVGRLATRHAPPVHIIMDDDATRRSDSREQGVEMSPRRPYAQILEG